MNDKSQEPVLLSGGNPQIAKGYGDAPVQAYIAAMPAWKHDIGRRIDAVIEQAVPGVRKAVKWNSPLYGLEDDGWFLSLHCFTRYVKVTFFRGASLEPPPDGRSKYPPSATSTSTRAPSTRTSSPIGSNRPAACRASGCKGLVCPCDRRTSGGGDPARQA